MKKTLNTTGITLESEAQNQNLDNFADQMSGLAERIFRISCTLYKFEQDLEILEKHFPEPVYKNEKSCTPAVSQFPHNIIPFPKSNISAHAQMRHSMPIIATPEKPLPSHIYDYRPVLQRNGLILLAWDKRETEAGERYTAYWVTSAGTARFYASKPLPLNKFYSAQPDHKSYAAEDGIEFYGQNTPSYIVHVAPELMMSNPRHGVLRSAHIKTLKEFGSAIDFDYKYLLSTEKNRNQPPKKPNREKQQRAGA